MPCQGRESVRVADVLRLPSTSLPVCVAAYSDSSYLQECPQLFSSVCHSPVLAISSVLFLFCPAHSIRSVSTSAAFSRIVALPDILAAATWSSSTVFTSFYLRDVQFTSVNGFGLGPVVAAGAVIT